MKKSLRRLLVCSAATVTVCGAGTAQAQQKTFGLDRLMVPGGPDDGIAIFRPATQPRNILFGQLAIGYSLRPLRTRNVTTDPGTLGRSATAVIQDQLAVYGTVGFQLLDRATFAVSFPFYPFQTGENPRYQGPGPGGGGPPGTTTVSTEGPASGDVRLDFRGTLWRTEDRRTAFGAQISVFAPSGTTTNFGGDGGTAAMALVNFEHTIKFITLVANTGLHFRPRHAINSARTNQGLGIGNEWRWALGAFVPIKDGKFRVGATIFGQTGVESDETILGDTTFTKQNTPIEWMAEGRMRFGPSDHWWLGAGAGSRLFLNAYGSPDFRIVALVGTYIPIFDSDAKSPERKAELRAKWKRERESDRDHDGIPDDIDACPDDAEDHLGNDPNDGCPMPPDKDGDGVPDQYDKCPNEPEDKDGIDDGDGCPELDADTDGIPDAQDACPRVPGKPSTDPKKNGCPTFISVGTDVVRVLQQVHFAFGTAQILPESFPVLTEVGDYLKSNKAIKKMSIEGHTDNRGSADLNKTLSAARAQAVMNWLVQHGVEANRLEAHGYGLEKPIETNDTDEGRAKNRRVEFKILEEEDTNKVKKTP